MIFKFKICNGRFHYEAPIYCTGMLSRIGIKKQRNYKKSVSSFFDVLVFYLQMHSID